MLWTVNNLMFQSKEALPQKQHLFLMLYTDVMAAVHYKKHAYTGLYTNLLDSSEEQSFLAFLYCSLLSYWTEHIVISWLRDNAPIGN